MALDIKRNHPPKPDKAEVPLRIKAGESLTTEFKREYTEEIKKTIIAFANTSGGTLYIGVNDDKSIAGVKNPDDTLLQVTNTVRSAIKPDITLFVDCKAE
jgi:ATP-dependent DNA helicase RecG